MRTRAHVISLLALVGATLGSLGASAESHSCRDDAQERSLWRAIAELRQEIESITSTPGSACSAPTEADDLVARRLALGSSQFTYGASIAPKLIVRDESSEVATVAFFKYSNGFANHMVQGRARGSIAAPENVKDNDVVAQYAGQGYQGGDFRKVGALNMQVDARGDLSGGMTGKLVFKVAGLDGEQHAFATAVQIDRRLRTLFEGAIALRYTTHPVVQSDQDDYELGDQRTSVHRIVTDAPREITGFVATHDIDSPVAGELMTLINVGAFDLILGDQSPRSRAPNRMITGNGANLALGPDETATLFYDQTSERWRVIATTGG